MWAPSLFFFFLSSPFLLSLSFSAWPDGGESSCSCHGEGPLALEERPGRPCQGEGKEGCKPLPRVTTLRAESVGTRLASAPMAEASAACGGGGIMVGKHGCESRKMRMLMKPSRRRCYWRERGRGGCERLPPSRDQRSRTQRRTCATLEHDGSGGHRAGGRREHGQLGVPCPPPLLL